MSNLQPMPSSRVMRAAAVLLSAIGLALLLPCVMSIYAAGVVSNCSNDTDLSNKLAGGGVVSFSCGPHATIVFASTKTIAQDTTIDGAGAITLSGGSSLRLFNVNPGVRLTLNDITLAHGYTTADGGAINSLGSLILSNTQFLDNHVGTSITVASGGAIYSGGPLTITNSVFDGNSASTHGGGIAIFALATLNNVTATHNTAFNGGAIYNQFYLTNLNNSTLVSNTAGASGGAIYNFSFLTLNNTAVISNAAGQSGGGIVTWSLLTLNSSTLASNMAAGNGGAIDNESGGNDSGAYVIVNNSRLHDNSAASDGGAIFNADYGHVTLANSVLNANGAGARGGGIDNQAGRLAINASWLYSNSAASGAAIFNFAVINRPATLTLTASTVSGNAASAGGGALYNSGFFAYTATASVISSTLSANAGGSMGGGILNTEGGILNVSDSTLSGNKAALGGGIYLNAGSAALVNATLSGNSANTSGGGLMLDTAGAATLLNVTLSNNGAITGGGLTISGSVQAVLTNTLIAYSSGGNCKGTVIAKYSLSSDVTCALVGTGNQNAVDPKLSVLGNFTGPTLVHMLKTGSPAINSGTASGAPGTDQRGYTRPQLGGIDIGAVERRASDSDFPIIPRLYLPVLLR